MSKLRGKFGKKNINNKNPVSPKKGLRKIQSDAMDFRSPT